MFQGGEGPRIKTTLRNIENHSQREVIFCIHQKAHVSTNNLPSHSLKTKEEEVIVVVVVVVVVIVTVVVVVGVAFSANDRSIQLYILHSMRIKSNFQKKLQWSKPAVDQTDYVQADAF